MTKIFSVTVKDETAQSWKIMDVKGYSHFSSPRDEYHQGIVREAFIYGWSNKVELTKAVKEALGNSYQKNLNYVVLVVS